MIRLYRGQIAFALLWLAGVGCIVASGFSVDGYQRHVLHIPPPYPYPLSGVIVMSLQLTVELAALYALIRPATFAQSWGRALCALVLSSGALLVSAMSLMHAPPYVLMHGLVLLGVTILLTGLFILTAGAALVGRAKRQGQHEQ